MGGLGRKLYKFINKMGTDARLYCILQYNVGGLGRKLYKFIDKMGTDARLYCILQ